MTKKITSLAVAAFGMLALTGCCSFQEESRIQGVHDREYDKDNQLFVQQAAQAYQERMQFTNETIVEIDSENARLFMSRAIGEEIPEDYKRSIIYQVENALRSQLGVRRDFKVITHKNPQTGEIIVNDSQAAKCQKMSFRITDISAKSSYQRNSQTNEISYVWDLSIAVEFNLITADGRNVFTSAVTMIPDTGFLGLSSIQTKSSGIKSLSPRVFQGMIESAVAQALAAYDKQFGPPVYVVRTCGNGKYVQLSAGTAYGFVRGREVEFFRYVERDVLDPVTGQYKKVLSEDILATGVIGNCGIGCKTPISADSCFVCLKGEHSVRTWTSVRLK